MDISGIKFDANGLVPAIAQDAATGSVLMMAYMNAESLQKTIETGLATYYSRSRRQLWTKGETSGNYQKVRAISYDCDGDCLLISVEQTGNACHTGEYSCFHNALTGEGKQFASAKVLYDVFAIIKDRLANPKEGSYTSYLFEKGLDKILKKVGEESAEFIIAAKNGDKIEMSKELADLLYHVMVTLAAVGVSLDDVFRELQSRR